MQLFLASALRSGAGLASVLRMPALTVLRQKPVQLVGKLVGVFLAERFGAFGRLAALSDLFHQIAHGKILFDVVNAVELAPVVDGMGLFGDDAVGERNVGRDDQVPLSDHLDDAVVRLVGTLLHYDVGNMVGVAQHYALVRNHKGRQREPFYTAKHDRFEQVGKSVTVNVECHCFIPR